MLNNLSTTASSDNYPTIFFFGIRGIRPGLYSFKDSFQGFIFIRKHPKTARQTTNGLIFGRIFASEIWGLYLEGHIFRSLRY